MSAQGFLDACGFIPVSSGTGSFVVSAAIQGYQTPASAGAQAIVYSYRSESADKSQWEEGFGAYNTTTNTLARTTITANSSGNTSAVNFSVAPNVFITALSTDLQNAALLTSGTLPVARINGGTANQFVQGDGTFQTQPRKLLNTLTASSSSTLSDTTSLTSAWNDYEIVFNNILAGTSGGQQLELFVHSGGSFQTTGYNGSMCNTGNGTVNDQNVSGFIPISVSGSISTTGGGYSGAWRVQNPSQTSSPKLFFGVGGAFGGTVLNAGYGAGAWNGGNGAVDGFQVQMGTGVILSGTIKIYGLL